MWLWPTAWGLQPRIVWQYGSRTHHFDRQSTLDGKSSRSMPSLGTVYTCCGPSTHRRTDGERERERRSDAQAWLEIKTQCKNSRMLRRNCGAAPAHKVKVDRNLEICTAAAVQCALDVLSQCSTGSLHTSGADKTCPATAEFDDARSQSWTTPGILGKLRLATAHPNGSPTVTMCFTLDGLECQISLQAKECQVPGQCSASTFHKPVPRVTHAVSMPKLVTNI